MSDNIENTEPVGDSGRSPADHSTPAEPTAPLVAGPGPDAAAEPAAGQAGGGSGAGSWAAQPGASQEQWTWWRDRPAPAATGSPASTGPDPAWVNPGAEPATTGSPASTGPDAAWVNPGAPTAGAGHPGGYGYPTGPTGSPAPAAPPGPSGPGYASTPGGGVPWAPHPGAAWGPVGAAPAGAGTEPAWAPVAGTPDPRAWAPSGASAGWGSPPPPPPPPGGPGAYQPWGYPAGPPPTPPRRRGLSALVVGTVAVVVAALIGAGIGRGFATHTTTYLPAQSQAGGSGSSPVFPGFPGSSGSSGSTGSSGSSSAGGSAPSAQASAIAAKVDPGIVDIDTKLGYEQAEAAGTGMILTSSGEILTNNHVINGATEITATVVTTGKTYKAKVVGYDQTQDIAVIQLEGASGLQTIKTGDSSALTAGSSVVAIGNAGGVGGSPSVVTGTIEATNQSITASDEGGGNAEQLSGLIETNAPIQAGDSGGPLVNTSAEVIGMDTAASAGTRFASQDSVGFAIPINQALSIAHQIESGQSTSTIHLGSTGFLGVSVEDASAQGAAGAFGSGSTGGATNPSATSGALIEGVESSSPASSIGLVNGDVITSVDGHTVTTARGLTTTMQAYHPGDKVTVGWTDGSGQTHTASATLVTGPAQ